MTLPGSLAQYQDIYDTIDAGAFSGMSDGSKSAFWNYIAAERANQHELDMWNLQNEYNDPSAQMARMVKAGINPAAAYQQINSGNASSAPGTHKPTYAFNNQEQKMQQVSTIINGLSSVLSSIGQVVNIAEGLQGIGITHQNNYTDHLRYQSMLNGGFTTYTSDDLKGYTSPYVRIGEDMFITPYDAVLYPELVGLGKLGSSYGTLDINRESSSLLDQIREKNLSVQRATEKLIDQMFNYSGDWRSMLQNAIQLIFVKLFKGSY